MKPALTRASRAVRVCWGSDMRRDVQEIFRSTPHDKQVMMFSATLSKEIRPVCRKFCQDVSGWLVVRVTVA